ERRAAMLLTLPRLKPGDARFCAAAYATAPRRLCPSLSMFLAALWSRCRLVPQSGQECQRTDKPLATMTPQRAHGWWWRPAAPRQLCARPMLPWRSGCSRSCSIQRRRSTLGEVVVLEPVGRLQVFVIDRIVLLNELERNLMVEVLSLPPHLQMSLGEQGH